MIKRIFSFSNLTLLVALALSAVAEFYSIMGLIAIFAGAVVPVIIMGVTLGVAKITTTVWLRKYWHRATLVLKLYLIPAVIALTFLTSMGIFGFLSKAHMDQGLTSGDVLAKISIYDEKIKTSKENIDANRKALKQLDEAVDQVMGRSTDEKGAEKAVAIRKGQSKDRVRLQAEIAMEQKAIASLNAERAPIAAEVRKVEAEVGPIKYIAALIYGDNPDANLLEKAVRWVIILIVIVFDPLAIALVLAANASKDWDKEEVKEDTPAYEPDDGPLTNDQIEQIQETVKKEPSDPTLAACFKCGTQLVNAPGIGPFCPNKECDVIDGPFTEEPVEITYEGVKLPGEEWIQTGPDIEIPKAKKKARVRKPKVTETIIEPEVVAEPVAEPVVKAEIVTEGVTKEKPFKELEGGYVLYEGAHMHKDVLLGKRPEFNKIVADSARASHSSFGSEFPKMAEKGDSFVRVDVLPNRVYKFDGVRWIMVNKDQSTSYLYDQEYINHLIQKINTGEYDIELLSDKEKQQIEEHLTHKR